MVPRMDDHPGSATSTASNSSNRIHQRRRDYKVQHSSLSSSYLVEMNSPGPSDDSNIEGRTLRASESQTSLVTSGGSNRSLSAQAPISKLCTSPLFTEWKPRLLLAWSMHFVACLSILSLGSMANHGKRKYIPVDVNTVDGDCVKAFVDVFSQSMDAPDAFVCCQSSEHSMNGSLICRPPPRYLVFARRLSRFPDAWLLPLFPLLIRGGFHLYHGFQRISSRTDSKTDSLLAKRRLYLYMALIQIRGWVLYWVFDEIEDLLVASPGEGCWYESMLHSSSQHCQGRMIDFSDHVVLYFAQILPIALTEVLHSFVVPFWELGRDTTVVTRGTRRNKSWIPLLLIMWLANLYLVTFLGAFKTARYFHTGPEVFTGFIVSLLVQVPLFLLQCTSIFPLTREYFYGPVLA